MGKSRHILILGNSVILAALGASLRLYSKYEVSSLATTPDLLELETLNPDVMIFDLENERPKAAFALLEKHPAMTLIGVSPDSNLVKIWTGQQLKEMSTQGLIETINEQFKKSATL